MSEDSVSGGTGEGLQVGVLDAVLLTGVLVVVVALFLRFRRNRHEEQIRSLKV